MGNEFLKNLYTKGIPGEETVAKILRQYDPDTYRIKGRDVEKDIVCPNLNRTFEVKNQANAKHNVVVEYGVYNKRGLTLTGLHRSTADYWVFLCWEKAIFIKRNMLEQIVADKDIQTYKKRQQIVYLRLAQIKQDLIPNSHKIYEL